MSSSSPPSKHSLYPLLRIFHYFPLDVKYRFIFLSFLVLLSAILESSLVGLSGPFFSSLLLTAGSDHSSPTPSGLASLPFATSTFLLAIIVVLSTFIKSFFLYYSATTSALAGTSLGQNLLTSLLYKDYSSFSESSRSEILSLLTTKTNKVVTTLNLSLRLIYSLFIVLSISTTLFVESPLLALASLSLISALYLLLGFFTRRPLAKISKDVNRLSSRQYVYLNDSLGSYIDTVLSNSQLHVIRGYRQIDHSLKRAEAFSLFYSLSPRVVIESFALLLLVLIFPYVIQSPTLIPAFASLAIGSQKLFPAAQEIYASWAITRALTYDLHEISHSLTNAERLPRTSSDPSSEFFSLSLESVSLSTESSLRLNPISLKLFRKNWTAIVGPSGCGKTTLLTLLLGLQQPTTGTISVNNSFITPQSLNSFSQKNLNMFSYVQQKPFLTESTLLDNIIRSQQEDPTLLKKVVDITGLTPLLDQLPQGLHTFLGFEANLLSGGQKQRVALARSLYQQRPILVLDESLNALDIFSVEQILRNLRQYLPDLTLVMVTHDPSLLRYFDNVVEMS